MAGCDVIVAIVSSGRAGRRNVAGIQGPGVDDSSRSALPARGGWASAPMAERNFLEISRRHGFTRLLVVPETSQHFARHLAIVEVDGPVFQHLIGLVALARQNDDVAGARFLDGACGWRPRGPARRCAATSVRRMPTSASFMIASGSSERGLSLVSTTKSLPSAAACPISGRLARSRSPPHPNNVMTRLGFEPARHRDGVAQRVVGVRVVHHYDERLAFVDALEAPRHGLQVRDAARDRFRRQAVAQPAQQAARML